MTKSTITRERLLEIIVTGPEASGAEQNELARMALAAMDSEPVAEVLSNRPGNDTSTIDRALPVGTQLYRHAQPAVAVTDDELNAALQLHRLKVDGHSQLSDAFRAGFRYARRTTAQSAVESDFIPKNLDKALGVLGMAIPESREEFNFQTERWIQRLIDRVIRYADEFQEQPAPVVPEKCPAEIRDLMASHSDELFNDDDAQEIWNACRAAMLHAGNSPAQSGCCPAQNSVVPAQSGSSPAIPDGYVLVPKEATKEILDEFDSIIDYGAEDSVDAWHRLLAAATQEVKP
ncbi:TPA: Eaa protein [Klebsiella quasipneumoniae]